MFQSLRDLGTEDSISFSFGGRVRTFYVLNIPAENIPQFQQRVTAFPPPPELSTLRGDATDIFHGGKAFGKNAFNSLTAVDVHADEDVVVAEAISSRVEQHPRAGTSLRTFV